MVRLNPEARRRMIAQAALKIAHERSLAHVTHGDVAKRCPVQTSRATVRHYFPTQIDLQVACVDLDNSLRQSAIELGVIPA